MSPTSLNRAIKRRWSIFSIFLLAACGGEETLSTDTGRWYTSAQVQSGNNLFQTNCAVCHGDQAQGFAEDWKLRDSAGNLPPPPLNGSAHTWHHPLALLDQVISTGGIPYGGTMPGFAELLNAESRLEVIAYFQSFWSVEIYETWAELNNSL